jgi:hypothetical protein
MVEAHTELEPRRRGVWSSERNGKGAALGGFNRSRKEKNGGVRHAVDGRRGPDGRPCVPTRSRVVRSRPERDGDGSWSGVETGEEQQRGDADAWGPSIVPAWFKPIQRFQMNSNQF